MCFNSHIVIYVKHNVSYTFSSFYSCTFKCECYLYIYIVYLNTWGILIYFNCFNCDNELMRLQECHRNVTRGYLLYFKITETCYK